MTNQNATLNLGILVGKLETLEAHSRIPRSVLTCFYQK